MNPFFIVLTHLFFASTFTVTKMALWYGTPFVLVTYRLLLGGLLLLGAYITKSGDFTALKDRYFWKSVCILSLCMAYIPYVGEYWVMDSLSSIKTVLLYNLSPFITALISFVVLKEQITYRQVVGMTIGFIGSMPLLFDTVFPTDIFKMLTSCTIGSIPEYVMLFVMVISAVGWIIMQQVQKQKKYPLLLLNGMIMLGGGLCAFGQSIAQGFLNKSVDLSIEQIVLFVVYASLLTLLSTLGHTLYSFVLTGFSATFVALTGLSIPIFTTIFSSILLKEVITLPCFISSIIVSFGLILFYTDESNK